MSKIWTEFKKSEFNSNLKYLAINGIEMELVHHNYQEYCVETLDNVLPEPSDLNYFALIVEEVEFPTRIDQYKKVWGKNNGIIRSSECSLSQEYVEEADGVTFFYGIIEIKKNVAKNIMEIIKENPDAVIFGEISKLEDLDVPNIFQKEIIKSNSDDILKKRDYPVYFQMIDSGFEICLYIFIAPLFSSKIEGNAKIDTERLKIEVNEIENKNWEIDEREIFIYSINDDRFGVVGDGIEVPDFFWLIGYIEGNSIWVDLSSKNHCVYEKVDGIVVLLFDEIMCFVEACKA
ncbi:hypothetical protein [Listeria newyorkensis]|nr:hypothetical protein [Listeria newyorkensis]